MSDETKDDTARDADRSGEPTVNRRGVFHAVGAAAAMAAAAAAVGLGETAQAAEEPGPTPPAGQPQNPYGGGPNTGITLPRPTPSVANANTFFPGVEELGADEMRISFVGSSPVPPTRAQAGTAIMVELGNGKRFFFDLGPGCLRKSSPCRCRCRWSMTFSSPICMSITSPSCRTSSPSRLGWDAGSRFA